MYYTRFVELNKIVADSVSIFCDQHEITNLWKIWASFGVSQEKEMTNNAKVSSMITDCPYFFIVKPKAAVFFKVSDCFPNDLISEENSSQKICL